MANTFTQVYIMLVFSPKYQAACIDYEWENKLYAYITGTIQSFEQKVMAINGEKDHIHIFISMNGSVAISHLVQEVKKASTKYINENKFCKGHFQWQNGFGAFSYSKKESQSVIEYVNNQKQHHLKKTFKEEYTELLKERGIPFDECYLFEFFD